MRCGEWCHGWQLQLVELIEALHIELEASKEETTEAFVQVRTHTNTLNHTEALNHTNDTDTALEREVQFKTVRLVYLIPTVTLTRWRSLAPANDLL